MKKYWKTLLISLVIITTIGTYYIQAPIASKNAISFNIETISGNKKEIENHIIEASYLSGNIHRQLYISKDGSTNRMSDSIVNEILPLSSIPRSFQKYIQEHRNFMRGKELVPSNYYEDESRLIYGTIANKNKKIIKGEPLTFQIEILDKDTNDHSSFEINTPALESIEWINVNDLRVDNGKIKILSTNFLLHGGEELHVYTFDEDTKQIEGDRIIAKSNPEERIVSGIRIFNNFNNFKNENYYLYLEKNDNDSGYGNSKGITSQLFLYNNTTNEVEELKLPEELEPHMNYMTLEGKDIFIPVPLAHGLKLNRYNIESKQWEEPLNFNYSSTTNDKEHPFLQLINGKLYAVSRVSDGHLLFIGDLLNGKTLYEGKITDENRENFDRDYSLYIEQLYLAE
ncbi:hypothetical protein [Ureibacillus sinduriensis]|uniref:Uncharacterized protein n=1 Tax=Ureibacillus sinduriensis BLB-1 = JCM 15800 TaxID=1384057 RepID=A0A0A3HWH8_9BACL|nr:hypothetical protein [Ureibacillus sinduriensis]KGR76956.1 hypothetical protein CD33_04580 [Ureibacillus sinduriensis BLB-1 = JCM 15800]